MERTSWPLPVMCTNFPSAASDGGFASTARRFRDELREMYGAQQGDAVRCAHSRCRCATHTWYVSRRQPVRRIGGRRVARAEGRFFERFRGATPSNGHSTRNWESYEFDRERHVSHLRRRLLDPSGAYARLSVNVIVFRPIVMALTYAAVGDRAGERALLERWVRAATTPQRIVWRSRIVLLALDGLAPREIARILDLSPPTVRLWLRRFAGGGAGSLLHDAPGRGRHPALDPATMLSKLREARLLDDHGQPTSLRDAARHLGVSPSTVWRALHKPAPET